jgi:hypothetical protein
MSKGLTTLGPKVKTDHGWCITTTVHLTVALPVVSYRSEIGLLHCGKKTDWVSSRRGSSGKHLDTTGRSATSWIELQNEKKLQDV